MKELSETAKALSERAKILWTNGLPGEMKRGWTCSSWGAPGVQVNFDGNIIALAAERRAAGLTWEEIRQEIITEHLESALAWCRFNEAKKVHVRRIPFGEEPPEFSHGYRNETCGDCGAPLGSYHHLRCDLECCPICGGQLCGCGCQDEYNLVPEHP